MKNGSVTEPANRDAVRRHDHASFAGRPGRNMPVAGEVGRGVDHPLREHDLAGEPAALVGAAELGCGRGDVGDGGIMATAVVGIGGGWGLVGGGGGGGLGRQEGVGEAARARLGVGAAGGLGLEGGVAAALLVGDGGALVGAAGVVLRRRHG